MLCTANETRSSCTLCERLINNGVIKNAYQMEQHHGMHGEESSNLRKDKKILKTEPSIDELIDADSTEECSLKKEAMDNEVCLEYLCHVYHYTGDIDRGIGIPLRRSDSHCKESRERFRKLLQVIDYNQMDLKQYFKERRYGRFSLS
ncbi:uncharacterized protein LOC133190793 [Saccostrea echinata]|uniref:uncharacterized protein LOC133190793 n=1 Tax=Saccostrea echinata TaxID=191078 RepID=UPI002A7F7C29|nr:uncharacterized protein LOC133190793 [Saccostrea echinata]